MTFPVPPGPQVFDQSYACWRGAFDPTARRAIIGLAESIPAKQGTVSSASTVSESIRRSYVSWIEPDERSQWLYTLVSRYISDLNARYFRFDLYGFVDSLQYTVYRGDAGHPGHYDWHMDMGMTAAPRKLSFSVNLSDPDEYVGGALNFLGISTTAGSAAAGDVNAFPSWVLHRVTPVTEGTRRSLVGWVAGSQFR